MVLPFDLSDTPQHPELLRGPGWVKIILKDGPNGTVDITIKANNPSQRCLDAAAILTSKIEGEA